MPPAIPAKTSWKNSRRSTFLFHKCDAPDTPVVTISAACTAALAMAGGAPSSMTAELAMIPNAMPSAPSTSWARNPIAT
jgi:hypothetical protein